MDGKSASFAEGAITLDIDVQAGPGVETTQFMNMDSGTFEVWVNHYDNTFTSTQVLDNPATVDVYCYQCLDDSGQQKAGYVRSVTQNAADVPGEGRNWWKVGEFTWPSGAVRAKWTTCDTECYKNAAQSDLTSTRALSSSAPKPGKEHRPAALLRGMHRQSHKLSIPRKSRLRALGSSGSCSIAEGHSDVFFTILSDSIGQFDISTLNDRAFSFSFEFFDCDLARIESFMPLSESIYGMTNMMVNVHKLPASLSPLDVKVDFCSVIANVIHIIRPASEGQEATDAVLQVQIPPAVI